MATLAIKSGTTAIAGSTVKGSFSYFSGSTKDLGPTSSTGFYSGVDAPSGGYTVYQIGGLNGWTARVATDNATLNSILISAGGTGSTVAQNITWATNTNSVYINSGTTVVSGNVYTFIDYTNPNVYSPLNGQISVGADGLYPEIYIAKIDFNGLTLATPQVGKIVTYGGISQGSITQVTNVTNYWVLLATSINNTGLVNNTNYTLTITS